MEGCYNMLSRTRQIDPPAAKFMTNSIKLTKRLSEIKNDEKLIIFTLFLPRIAGTHKGEVCVLSQRQFVSFSSAQFFIISHFLRTSKFGERVS